MKGSKIRMNIYFVVLGFTLALGTIIFPDKNNLINIVITTSGCLCVLAGGYEIGKVSQNESYRKS